MRQSMLDLIREARASKWWEWLPGMLAQSPSGDLLRVEPLGPAPKMSDLWRQSQLFESLPVITDPATLGCLLALVRRAWGMPTGITVSYSDDEARWFVSWSGATHGGVCGDGAVEGEALLRALLNAP